MCVVEHRFVQRRQEPLKEVLPAHGARVPASPLRRDACIRNILVRSTSTLPSVSSPIQAAIIARLSARSSSAGRSTVDKVVSSAPLPHGRVEGDYHDDSTLPGSSAILPGALTYREPLVGSVAEYNSPVDHRELLPEPGRIGRTLTQSLCVGARPDAIPGCRDALRGIDGMQTTLGNRIATLAVFLALAVAICSAPAFGQVSLERAVRTALENAPLVERIDSVTVRDSAFNRKGEGTFRKKDSDGSPMVDASGNPVYDVLTAGGVVTSTEGPAKMVEVVFVANPSFTTRLTKRGIERAMMDGYQAMFMNHVPVLQGSIEAKMKLVDSAGNESVGLVYGTKLRAEVAERVNWKNRHVIDPSGVWDAYFMNNAFR